MFKACLRLIPLGAVALTFQQPFCLEKSTSTYMWGNGHYQSIPGAPIKFENYYPKKIDELKNFSSFAFSQQLEAGINNKGELYVWPSKKVLFYVEPDYKQTRQHLIKLMDDAVQVKFTNGFVWALNKNGEVFQWKLNKEQKDVWLGDMNHIKPLQKIKQISSGRDHFLALDQSGSVFSMGENTLGQCGLLDNSRTTSPPFTQNRVSFPEVVPNLPPITKIACGTNHSLAIDNNGTLYGWGSNSNMQLSYQEQFSKSQNPLLCSYCPIKLNKKIDNLKVIDVEGGQQFTLINVQNPRDKSYEMYSVGSNLKGQLGLGQMCHLKDITRIDSLSNYVYTNDKGQSQVVTVDQLSCGKTHSLVLLNIGYVLQWGDNEFGQMGNKKRSAIHKPTIIRGFLNKKVKGVYAGEYTSVVVVEDE